MLRRPLHRSRLLWALRRRPLLWWACTTLVVLGAAATAASLLAASAPACDPPVRGGPPPASTSAAAEPIELASGHRALAVPTSGGLALAVGDHVDLIAPAEPDVEGEASRAAGTVVADAALVLDVQAEVVTVGVTEVEVATAAVAVARGGTTLVRRPPP